jgi:hypothetical protein
MTSLVEDRRGKPIAGTPFYVTYLYPVIYTGTQGGGPDEYLASSDPNEANVYEIKVAPSGANVVTAWYTPIHNIPALSAFALIDVAKRLSSGEDINLAVASWPGTQDRLRIKITVLYTV